MNVLFVSTSFRVFSNYFFLHVIFVLFVIWNEKECTASFHTLSCNEFSTTTNKVNSTAYPK